MPFKPRPHINLLFQRFYSKTSGCVGQKSNQANAVLTLAANAYWFYWKPTGFCRHGYNPACGPIPTSAHSSQFGRFGTSEKNRGGNVVTMATREDGLLLLELSFKISFRYKELRKKNTNSQLFLFHNDEDETRHRWVRSNLRTSHTHTHTHADTVCHTLYIR